MARNPDRYVRYYTFGSAAPKLDRPEPRQKLPKMKPAQKRKPLPIDPVAVLGSTVALLLAVLMVVGLAQVTGTNARIREMETEVMTLEMEQEALRELYEAGYDLEEVRDEALSMGMIPADDAQHIRVSISTRSAEVPRLSWWDTLLVSMRQFFA